MAIIISNITSNTGNTPTRGDEAFNGNEMYEDETHTFNPISAVFFHKEFLKVHNADETYSGAIAYTFDLAVRSRIFVCVDPAMTVLPAWLDDGIWVEFYEFVKTDNSSKNYIAYYKDYNAGDTVELGGNSQSPEAGATENYTVLIQEIGPVADNLFMKNITVVTDAAFRTVNMAVALLVHYDEVLDGVREWVTIPDKYLGLVTLQTSDRERVVNGFRSKTTQPYPIVKYTYIIFSVERNVVVYVAYNIRSGSTTTDWLDGRSILHHSAWTDTGDDLIDDVGGSTGVYRVFSKTFVAGSTIILGENNSGVSSVGHHFIVMVEPNDLPMTTVTDELITGALVNRMLSRCNMPYTQVTMQIGDESVLDITTFLISVPIIDRQKGVFPSDGHTLKQTDAVFTVSNLNGFFSPQDSASIFFNKDYFDAKIIVYAGFFSTIEESIIDSTATVTSQLVVYLDQVRVNSDGRTAELVCRGTSKKIERLKVGEPDSNGDPDDLEYSGSQSFQTIVESLLGVHGGLDASEYNVQNVALNFTDATFSDIGIIDAVSKLCQAATCGFYEDRKGALTIDTFSIDFGEVDIREVTESEAIIRLFASENVNNLISKISVTGDTGIYEENDTSGNAKGQIINISNDLVQSSGNAVDIMDDLFLRWGTNQPLIEVDTIFMPTVDVGDIIQILENQTGIVNFEYEVYRVQVDTKSYKMVMYGIRQDLSQKFAFVGSEETEASDPSAPQNNNYDAASDYDKSFCYSRDRADATTDQPFYVYGRRV